MSNNTVNAALRAMGYSKEIMTGHGFRALTRTIMDEVLSDRVVLIEHQLAHQVKDVNGRAYNRTLHLPARKAMMQRWANYLNSLKTYGQPNFMTLTSRDKPQKGNKQRLSIYQHTFPKRSIARFARLNDKKYVVETCLKPTGLCLPLQPSDQIFCAKLRWGHAAEKQLAGIDGIFQNLADRIVAGHTELSTGEHETITTFYISWTLRHALKRKPVRDQVSSGFRLPTRDLEELFEIQPGVFFIRGDGVLPRRLIAGSLLGIYTEINFEGLKATRWGIRKSHSKHENFIAPDNFANFKIVPLDPQTLLIAGSSNGMLDAQSVRLYNSLAVRTADNYYFSSSFEKCPITYSPIQVDPRAGENNVPTSFLPESIGEVFKPFPDL